DLSEIDAHGRGVRSRARAKHAGGRLAKRGAGIRHESFVPLDDALHVPAEMAEEHPIALAECPMKAGLIVAGATDVSGFDDRERGEHDAQRTSLAQFVQPARVELSCARQDALKVSGEPVHRALPFGKKAVRPSAIRPLAELNLRDRLIDSALSRHVNGE